MNRRLLGLTSIFGCAVIAFGQAQAASNPDGPAGPWVPAWATLTIKPSSRDETRIEFGTIRLNPDTRQLDYWMRRTQRHTVQKADSMTCPAMRAVIGEMKRIEPLQPDPPGFSDKDILITMDGTLYRLEGPGNFSDSHSGSFMMEANVGTPLAQWARRVEKALALCWK
ncbi:hypothetical protein D0Z70_17880 [Sphingobium terrigena]|jgi:hypothetical protein|uniref:Uncharacterized protein n=1 Tax=Sphingobium terrigena TaxID=2304063 RepID=A0A418YNS4_9SPHN|nr:hypothetical protein [Sphingobium terrigena]RJG52911.1 hypothetical protein D0Z70_17880 [Sphingobium terrigena]